MQPLISCLVLTVIHGLFVTAEYSIVKTSNRDREDPPTRYSRELSQIHEKLEEYLLVSQIGKTGALMAMGILLGRFSWNPELVQVMPGTVSHFLTSGQIVLVFITIGLTQLVLGQEVPKYWGVMRSHKCAEALSGYMKFSYFLVWPISWIIKYLGAALAHRRD